MIGSISTALPAFLCVWFAWIGVSFVNGARANVTLRMGLSYDINPECDETVYKVIVCAGEFTNECQLLGPVARFIQAACAAQGSAEPLTFSVKTVENPIELDVTVQRVGENTHHRLRRTEFRLTEGGEISVTSLDLTLIVRFQVDYYCLPNYFGKLCDKFCDTKAEEHVCDEWGNPICRSGYFLDQKSGECRKDKCLSMPNYCLNGGTCVNSPGIDTKPRCLCPSNYGGLQCEFEHQSTAAFKSTPRVPISTVGQDLQSQSNLHQLSTTVSSQAVVNLKRRVDSNTNNVTLLPTRVLKESVPTSTISTSKVKKNVPMLESANADGVQTKSDNKVETNVYLKSSSEESRYREILVPIVVATLILALLTVCIGFLIWMCSRKERKKHRPNKLQWDQPDSNALVNPTKRWASVDQSPTRLYTFDDQKLSNPVCLPSLGGAQFSTFCDQVIDRDPTYGGSMHTSFIPTHYSGMESYNLGSDHHHHHPWMEGNNRFATLPRPFNPRRGPEDPCRTDPLLSPFTQYSNFTRISPSFGPTVTDSLVDHYLRPSTVIGQSLMEQAPRHPSFLTPVMSLPTSADGLSHVYPPHSSRAPSINSACLNNFEPNTSSMIYGSVTVPRESAHTLVTNIDMNSPDIPKSSTPMDVPAQSGAVATLPPPPPSQFADTFLKSEC